MSRLRTLLFYLIVLFLPTQLGLHFWPSFAYVLGVRVDYLSPTLYLTDIFIILLFFVFIFPLRKFSIFPPKVDPPLADNFQFLILLLVVLVFIGSIGSIIFSLSPIAGIYKLIKILEFIFFGFMVAKNMRTKKDFSVLIVLLTAGIIFESALSIWQFVAQSSIGGILWFFGERMFSAQTPGIANANIDGRLVLRPYGTFPHPNVLAGYLTIAMAMVTSNLKLQTLNLKPAIFTASLIIGTIALFLTLSRVAIILWLIVAGVWFLMKWRRFLFIGLLVVLVFIGSIWLTPLPSRFASIATTDREPVILRQQLNGAAMEMFKSSPIFGVGLNNFLVNLPRYQKYPAGFLSIQPAHNIYLLILAETGLVGFLLFVWFIVKTYLRIKDKKFIILFVILILGLFDHYFLTLQQGQLLLALVFGLAWSPFIKKNKTGLRPAKGGA